MNSQWTTHRCRCYTKTPTVQDGQCSVVMVTHWRRCANKPEPELHMVWRNNLRIQTGLLPAPRRYSVPSLFRPMRKWHALWWITTATLNFFSSSCILFTIHIWRENPKVLPALYKATPWMFSTTQQHICKVTVAYHTLQLWLHLRWCTNSHTQHNKAPYPSQHHTQHNKAPYPSQHHTQYNKAPYPSQHHTQYNRDPYPSSHSQPSTPYLVNLLKFEATFLAIIQWGTSLLSLPIINTLLG